MKHSMHVELLFKFLKIIPMKKVILSAMLYASIVGFSQEPTSALLYTPAQAQGYMVLNSNDNPNVERWEIDYSTKTIDANGNDVYTVVDKTLLSNQSYTKVKESVLQNSSYVTIQGYSSSGSMLVNEGPIIISIDWDNDNVYNLAGQWDCNGTNYAYSIKHSVNATGQSKLALSTTTSPVLYTGNNTLYYDLNYPFFQYTTPAGYAGLVAYHGIHPQHSAPVDNYHTVNFQNTTNVYYSASGMPLTNNVYGVAKGLGPWTGGMMTLPNDITLDLNFVADMTTSQIVTIFNSNGGSVLLANEGLPPLQCYSAIGGYNSIGVLEPCFEDISFALGIDGDINNFIDDLDVDCWPVSNYDFDLLSIWAVPVENPSGGVPIIVRPFGTQEFDEYGNINSNPVTLTPNLYRVNVENSNGEYFSIVKEVTETFVNSLDMSDFLAVSAFPVPFTGNEFTLNLVATANVKFDYTLSDLNGVVYYQETIALRENDDINHVIKAINGEDFPTGILVNNFNFADGSTESFQIIKN